MRDDPEAPGTAPFPWRWAWAWMAVVVVGYCALVPTPPAPPRARYVFVVPREYPPPEWAVELDAALGAPPEEPTGPTYPPPGPFGLWRAARWVIADGDAVPSGR